MGGEISKIFDEIDDKIQQRNLEGKLERAFICYSELQDIWHDQQRIVTVLPTMHDAHQLDFIQSKMIIILSILVYIGAHKEFQNLFPAGTANLQEPYLDDSKLPFEMEQLSFIRSESAAAHRRAFDSWQFLFIPVTIKETKSHSTQVVQPKMRLPFLWKEENIGEGGFGEVSLIEIPRDYLIDQARGGNGKVSSRCQRSYSSTNRR
jgi:hypothetical protein